MTTGNRDAAIAALARFGLSPSHEQLARYWLSLWWNGHPPARAAFNPAHVRHLLPGMGIFEVRVGESVRCRLAGGLLAQSIGREISGRDWRDYTPKNHWAARLARNTQIAMGAVGIGVRHGIADDGPTRVTELQLPFGGETEDGARLMLFHLDWRPAIYESYRPNGEATAGIADEFLAIAL